MVCDCGMKRCQKDFMIGNKMNIRYIIFLKYETLFSNK